MGKKLKLRYSADETSPLTGILKNKKKQSRFRWWHLPIALALTYFVVLSVFALGRQHGNRRNDDDAQTPISGDACPQFPAFESAGLTEERQNFEDAIKAQLSSDEFFKESTKRVQGAVQIPTESFDDMGEVREDERWEAFVWFHKFLIETFPLV